MLSFGLKCIICYLTVLFGFTLHFFVWYDIFCYLMVLHGIVMYWIVLHWIVWYLMLSFGIQLHCTVLRCWLRRCVSQDAYLLHVYCEMLTTTWATKRHIAKFPSFVWVGSVAPRHWFNKLLDQQIWKVTKVPHPRCQGCDSSCDRQYCQSCRRVCGDRWTTTSEEEDFLIKSPQKHIRCNFGHQIEPLELDTKLNTLMVHLVT